MSVRVLSGKHEYLPSDSVSLYFSDNTVHACVILLYSIRRNRVELMRWDGHHHVLTIEAFLQSVQYAKTRINTLRSTASRNAKRPNSNVHIRIVQYYKLTCWICGDFGPEVDHVKPVTKGGRNWPANLRPICSICNNLKANRWPIDRATLRVERFMWLLKNGN